MLKELHHEDDSGSDDDDADFNFDTVAVQAVSAMASSGLSAASSSSSRELQELGLDVGLTSEHLYLKGSGRKSNAFDTSAPPGVCSLDAQDFAAGAGPMAPVAKTRTRDVRGEKVRPVNDKYLREKEARAAKEAKLEKWFGMPKRKLTPEMEKELQALKLRGSLDPKRFYKANDSKALPTHFQFATETGGGLAPAGLAPNPEVNWNSGRSFLSSILRDSKSQEWTTKKHGEVGARGEAAYNSGHGKPGKKGRKGLKSTKRGGAWKKKRKG